MTADIPIVFCAGTDPVVVGLVESFAKPGGDSQASTTRPPTLPRKRLELLKEIVPKLRRVVTFYDPRISSSRSSPPSQRGRLHGCWESSLSNGTSLPSRNFGRGCERSGQAKSDAYFTVSDPMANNQAQLIIDTARVKKLPTMFDRHKSCHQGRSR